MLQGEMDAHLGHENHSAEGDNTGDSRNGSFPKKIRTQHGEIVIQELYDGNSDFERVVVAKRRSRGLSIECLVISFYANDMNVSGIGNELRRYAGSTFHLRLSSLLPTSLRRLPPNGRTSLWNACICLSGWDRIQSQGVGQGHQENRLSMCRFDYQMFFR
ncbi:MAG: transposase [Prevotellaceae bacterium]|jgi:hypothetical protein|nr:transposase [Prevotellaceae bacterium]